MIAGPHNGPRGSSDNSGIHGERGLADDILISPGARQSAAKCAGTQMKRALMHLIEQ